MEQMKSNAMRMNQKEKGIRFSPQILQMALSLYICSPVGYREFKKSSLMIFPSDQTLQCMISNMMVTDGICQKTYQWFYDEVVSQMADETEKSGHIMCDKLQIKSTLCQNTQSHALVGFVTDTSELNFIEELKALESTRKEDGRSIDNQSDVHDDDKIAKKINQWRLRTVQG